VIVHISMGDCVSSSNHEDNLYNKILVASKLTICNAKI
jgi:hypothetical protein